MRSIGTPAELERRRHLAVQRVAEGYPAEEVADFLGVDPRSVRRWLASFCDGALAARPAPGRPPKLSSTQEKLVSRWLQHSPTDFGFANELWTGPRLARLIEQEWRVHFHPRYLAAWLRARDYSPQRPRRIPRERDRQAIARWRVQDWPRIKAEARRLGAHLALIDESGLLLGPLLRRTWAPVGQTPELLQRSRHRDKVSVAAAVWLPPGRGGRLGLSFWTLENGYFNNVAVAAFLGELLGELGSPLVVVWDGGSMHKGDPIRELVGQSAGRLVLERLPPYGPELMPVEYLWAWLKDDRLCNFAPYSVRELNEAASAELKAAQKDQRQLRGFFHACSLPLPRTLLT
jgi:transposase